MEKLSTIPLRRFVDLQDGSYCDRVALYENLRLTSKALHRALPPLQPTDPMVSSCRLVRLIAAATRVFTARLRAVSPRPMVDWRGLPARVAPYAAARPSVAEYDALMADVRRLGETADLTNPELADLLRYDDDRINVRLRIYLHSRGLKFPHVLTRYQHNCDPGDTTDLQLNPDTRLMQSTLLGTWSGMVTLLLKPTDYSTIQAPDSHDDYDIAMFPTVETSREFWEAAGVRADRIRLIVSDWYNFPPPTTGAIMPASEAVVLLRNLPPGYAVGVEGHERQLDVICATGKVEE